MVNIKEWTASELFEYLWNENIIETFEKLENWIHDRPLMIQMVEAYIMENEGIEV